MKTAAKKSIAILSYCCATCKTTEAFALPSTRPQPSGAWSLTASRDNTRIAAVGFGKTAEKETIAESSPKKEEEVTAEMLGIENGTEGAKHELLQIIPKMTGKDPAQNLRVETLINYLESQYQQCHTIDFFNLAVGGEWQFVFSTNLKNGISRDLRLTSFKQVIEGEGYQGKVTTIAGFDMQYQHATENSDDESDGVVDDDADYLSSMGMMMPPAFDVAYTGAFSISSTYEMVDQSTRMKIALGAHTVNEIKGEIKPDNDVVQTLFSMLMRALPFELFDPNDLFLDTTYVDGDIRIVRHSGKLKLEGVRNIFVRTGSGISFDAPDVN